MSLHFLSIVLKTNKFKQECDISLCVEKLCKGITYVYIKFIKNLCIHKNKCMLCRAYITIYFIGDYKSWKKVGGKYQ